MPFRDWESPRRSRNLEVDVDALAEKQQIQILTALF